MSTIPNSVDHVPGNAASGHLPGGAAPTLMNPVNDSMGTLSTMISREQREGMPAGQQDLMDQMVRAIQQKPEASPHVDMGGKDIRPSDLAAQFNPNMDQETHLDTGRGDNMVIIV